MLQSSPILRQSLALGVWCCCLLAAQASLAQDIIIDSESVETTETTPVIDGESPDSLPEDLPPALEPLPNETTSEFDAVEFDTSEFDTVEPAVEDIPRVLIELDTRAEPLLRPTDPNDVTIDTTQPLTLVEAIAVARQNNRTLQQQQLLLEQQRAVLDEARAALYPQLTLNGNATRDRSFSDTDVTRGSLPLTSTKISRSSTTTLDGNVRLDYTLLDKSRGPQIEAARLGVEQAELAVQETLATIQLNVSLSYYDLQSANEQVRIAAESVRAAQQSLQDAQALERAGVGTKFAVLQAEVQLSNEQQTLVQSESSQRQAERALAAILSIPQSTELRAADPVEPAGTWSLSLPDSIILAYANREELDQELLSREIAEQQRQAALGAIRPTIGFFAQFGGTRSFDGTDSETFAGTDSNLDTSVGARDFSFGLNFQWRLFDGGAARAGARQQEVSQDLADVTFAQERDTVRQDVEDAFYDLESNLKNIDTAILSVEQAREALRLARLRFQAGVGTQSDVIDAERDLTTAEGNRVTAIIGYNQALISMYRAVAEFPEFAAVDELDIPPYTSDAADLQDSAAAERSDDEALDDDANSSTEDLNLDAPESQFSPVESEPLDEPGSTELPPIDSDELETFDLDLQSLTLDAEATIAGS
ncbi:MAG: TolC family protein [Cyanobacteria bacterium P01_H01_bin.121]